MLLVLLYIQNPNEHHLRHRHRRLERHLHHHRQLVNIQLMMFLLVQSKQKIL
jgi:hypothetical protein